MANLWIIILSVFLITANEESDHSYDAISIYNNITQNPDIISGLQIAAGVLVGKSNF